MHLRSLQIENFKSFERSEVVQLSPGVTVIVGANNSGKSALLEAMSLSPRANPFRNLHRVTSRDTYVDPAWTLRFDLEFTREDLERTVASVQAGNRQIAVPRHDPPPLNRNHGQPDSQELATTATTVLRKIRSASSTYLLRGEATSNGFVTAGGGPYFGAYEPWTDSDGMRWVFGQGSSDRVHWQAEQSARQHGFDLRVHAIEYARSIIYRFVAERSGLGECPASLPTDQLAPNAANLPAILLKISSENPARWQRIVSHVKRILPTVHGRADP